ncbi:MAG TPA: hypothetical protein VKY26_11425, partial [Actinomycetota bacterium]|nr:hypothetical protein [Actinomycetota bacterium]
MSGALLVGPGAFPGLAATLTISGTMEGNLPIKPGDRLEVGYDFTIPGGPSAADAVTVSGASVVVKAVCSNGSSSQLTVALPSASYAIPAGNSQWFPSGDQSSSLVWQGSLTVPTSFCGGQAGHAPDGATFTAN